MFVWLWLFAYGILSITASKDDVTIQSMTEEYNTDNIVLESISRDDNINIDNSLEIELPENIKNNVASDIDDNDNFRRNLKGDDNPKTFTDFIKAVINILHKYNDADLEYFFNIFNKEVGEYHYYGCKFYELTRNDAFNEFMARQFDDIKNKPPADIRQNLVKITHQIEKATHNSYIKELIDYVNSLYKQDSFQKIYKFLAKLKDYRLRTNKELNLVKIVRDGIRSLLFNHYTKLDYNTRAATKFKLDQYWEYLMKPPSLRSQLSDRDDLLLKDENKCSEKFHFIKKDMYKSAINKNSKIRNLMFMKTHPNLVMDRKMGYSQAKPYRQQNTLSQISTTELILYRPSRDITQGSSKQIVVEDFKSFKESTAQNTKDSTKNIIKQQYVSPSNNEYSIENYSNENDTNDESSENLPIFVYKKKNSNIPTSTYMSLSKEDMDIPTIKQLLTEEEYVQDRYRHRRPIQVRYEGSRDTKASVAFLYTIDFLKTTTHKPQIIIKRSTNSKSYHTRPARKSNHLTQGIDNMPTVIRRALTYEPFINWAASESPVPKDIDKSKTFKLEKTQLYSRQQQSPQRAHTSLNEDASTADKSLFIEEVNQDDSQPDYRRHYNNDLQANIIHNDKGIFNLLQELQNQLDDMKNLAQNDAEITKQLKSSVHPADSRFRKEYVSANVIPCTKDPRASKNSHYQNVDNPDTRPDYTINSNDNYDKDKNEILTNDFDRNNYYLASYEHLNDNDRKIKNDAKNHTHIENYTKYNSDAEREVMPNLNRLQYKINKNNLTRFDSNQEHALHKNYRRPRNNKVIENKNKLDGPTKSIYNNKSRHKKHRNRNRDTTKYEESIKKHRYKYTDNNFNYNQSNKNEDSTRNTKSLKNHSGTTILINDNPKVASVLTHLNMRNELKLNLLNSRRTKKNNEEKIRNKLNGTTKLINNNKRRNTNFRNQTSNKDTNQNAESTRKTIYSFTVNHFKHNYSKKNENSTRKTEGPKKYISTSTVFNNKTIFPSVLSRFNTTNKLQQNLFNSCRTMENKETQIRNKLNESTKSIDYNKRSQEMYKGHKVKVRQSTKKEKYTGYNTTLDSISYKNTNKSNNYTRTTKIIKNFTTSKSNVIHSQTAFEVRNLNIIKKSQIDLIKIKIKANHTSNISKYITHSLNHSMQYTENYKTQADMVTQSYTDVLVSEKYLGNYFVTSKNQNNKKSSRNESDIDKHNEIGNTVTTKNTIQATFNLINTTSKKAMKSNPTVRKSNKNMTR